MGASSERLGEVEGRQALGQDPAHVVEHVESLVVGGGQAGLAVSHELARNGVEHVVLERGHVGQSWRDRWESFQSAFSRWRLTA